jgi:hypothetical protein
MALGVLIVQLFIAPMGNNDHLGPWAYLYRDVSRVPTLAWKRFVLDDALLIPMRRIRWWRGLALTALAVLPKLPPVARRSTPPGRSVARAIAVRIA